MGFDQMMIFYNHFCVRSAKAIAIAKSTTASSPTFCLRLDADNVALTSIDRIVEYGGYVTAVLGIKGTYGETHELSLGVDIAHIQGVSRSAITADSTLRGSASASPSEITYLHAYLWDTTGTTGSCQVDIRIDFVVTFLEPRDTVLSIEEVHRQALSRVRPSRTEEKVPVSEPPLSQLEIAAFRLALGK